MSNSINFPASPSGVDAHPARGVKASGAIEQLTVTSVQLQNCHGAMGHGAVSSRGTTIKSLLGAMVRGTAESHSLH